jgi:hypothetical protein
MGRTEAGGEEIEQAYRVELGHRLRAARELLGWSLGRTERESNGRFPASTLGAWERAQRTIGITSLYAIAELYRVPVSGFLPKTGRPTAPADSVAGLGPVVLDVGALSNLPVQLARPLIRYATIVLAARNIDTADHLAVRTADLFVLATILDTTPADLLDQLDRWHALVPADSD